MEAVYEWIRQISVFAVLSFLVLYLMGNQGKNHVLRFYLSLLMFLLILRPAVSLFHLDQALEEKLEKLETETEMYAVNGQIEQAASDSNRELLDYASQRALSWIEGLVQEKNLSVQEGNITFNEEKLEQTGEMELSDIRITVCRNGISLTEMQPVLRKLKKEIAEAFGLDQNAVSVKAGVQGSES